MKTSDCKFISLNNFLDHRGELTIIESGKNIPFEIKRVYFITPTDFTAKRGCHAHKNLLQLIVPINGAFSVSLDDGICKTTHQLTDPTQGLLIQKMIWREIYNFTENATCLVIASQHYDANDYIYSYENFKRLASIND